MKKAVVVLSAVWMCSAAYGASPKVLVGDEVRPLMQQIPVKGGWTLDDFIRRNHLKVLTASAGPAEPLENLRPSDYVIDVMLDRDVNFDELPCDLKNIVGGGYARYVKRGKRFLPDAPLAEFLTTGECPRHE